jgi:hypothetical protein
MVHVIATFDDFGDDVSGFLVRAEFVPDDYQPEREVLQLTLHRDGNYFTVYARDGMRLAIIEAVLLAGENELAENSYITITFTGMRGRRKVYHVSYEPPDPCGCAR